MKHLKYFESEQHEEGYIKDYGVTPTDIEFLFTDLIDNGWVVKTSFNKKLYTYDGSFVRSDIDIKLNLIPYIKVSITQGWLNKSIFSIWQATKYLNQLINSPEYLEVIEVVSLRLSDSDLFIHKQYIEDKQIHILIYRKKDKNYIK